MWIGITVYTSTDYTDSNKMHDFYIHFIWYKNDIPAYKQFWMTV